MPTRYAGFFCSDHHFNVVETYAVARPHAHVSVDKVVSRQAQFRCGRCGKIFSFNRETLRLQTGQMLGRAVSPQTCDGGMF